MTINFWLVAFYVFATLNILIVYAVSRILSRSKFRSEDGDISTEVGYEEDPAGNPRTQYRFPSQEEIDDPHIVIETFMQ